VRKFLLIIILNLIVLPLAASPYWDQFKSPEKVSADLIRFGVGPSVLFGDISRTYKDPGPSFAVDWMFYRWRNKGNSGFDLYSRAGASIYHGKGNLEKFMCTGTLDTGCRAILSSFFFPEKLQYYIMAGPRLLYFREKITEDNFDFIESKNLFSLGVAAGAGVEFSPFRSWGFFLEITGGYCPVGDSKANADGVHLMLGSTFRTQIR